jgi:hypothetical protein
MKVCRTIGVLFALMLAIAGQAYPCDCQFGGSAVCQDYWKASAVFVGTVIESKTVSIKRGEYQVQQRLVRFSLDEPFRGVEGAQVEVMTGMGGGDCGIGFTQTQQYLVYASSFEGKLYTGICMRTKRISAAAADLEYMRGLKNVTSGAAVYGEVTVNKRNEKGETVRQWVPGARIIIDGADKKEVRTDAKGAYRVDALPVGDYTVKILLPENMTTSQTEEKISLARGGCAVVSFWLENDGQLNGRIFNPQGLAVNNAQVFLTEFDKERYRGHWDAAYSDAEGRYAFKRIPSGRYILLIRFDGLTDQKSPFPITYYPGVSDRDQARVITVGEGQIIADYNLEMPPLPLEHEVTGSVVWSNGKPAAGARVGYLVVGGSTFYGAKVDGANFSLQAYEGLRLTMRASIEPEKGKTVYSDWVEVTVMLGLAPLKLVLPQP